MLGGAAAVVDVFKDVGGVCGWVGIRYIRWVVVIAAKRTCGSTLRTSLARAATPATRVSTSSRLRAIMRSFFKTCSHQALNFLLILTGGVKV